MALQASSLSIDAVVLAEGFSLLVLARLSVFRTFVDIFDRGLERRRVTAGSAVTFSGSILCRKCLCWKVCSSGTDPVIQLSSCHTLLCNYITQDLRGWPVRPGCDACLHINSLRALRMRITAIMSYPLAKTALVK
jgi:hypothetical protein